MATAHKWTEASQSLNKMKIEEEDAGAYSHMPPVLDPTEAERFVEKLQKLQVEEVGSAKWFEQHRMIEKLNLQAHHNAMTNSDEYVLEAFLTFDKLHTLIHNLIVIETWKESVYPLILDAVAGRNNMRVYFILYHEATLVNLLEVFLYHKHVCQAGGEMMIELVDYCARKLTRISSGYDFRQVDPHASSGAAGPLRGAGKEYSSEAVKAINAEIEARTPKEELAQYLTEIEFKVCISAATLIRYVCEHAEALPLSVVTRVTDTHDMLILVVPLIENPPWSRRLKTGKWQKLIDNKWTDVLPIDLLKLTKLEGQVWLALYHLLAKQVFRERYHLNTFRKAQLLRARKYLNDTLLDQLPVLADIQRYMDELALTEVPEPHDARQSVFLFQQVAVTRETLVRGKNWPAVAAEQLRAVFTMTDRDDRDLRLLADLYSDDLAGNVLDPEGYLEKISKEMEGIDLKSN